MRTALALTLLFALVVVAVAPASAGLRFWCYYVTGVVENSHTGVPSIRIERIEIENDKGMRTSHPQQSQLVGRAVEIANNDGSAAPGSRVTVDAHFLDESGNPTADVSDRLYVHWTTVKAIN